MIHGPRKSKKFTFASLFLVASFFIGLASAEDLQYNNPKLPQIIPEDRIPFCPSGNGTNCTACDDRFVNVVGDTMTGNLTMLAADTNYDIDQGPSWFGGNIRITAVSDISFDYMRFDSPSGYKFFSTNRKTAEFDGNVTAVNLCLTNGFCLSNTSAGSSSNVNIAYLNNTQRFLGDNTFNGTVNVTGNLAVFQKEPFCLLNSSATNGSICSTPLSVTGDRYILVDTSVKNVYALSINETRLNATINDRISKTPASFNNSNFLYQNDSRLYYAYDNVTASTTLYNTFAIPNEFQYANTTVSSPYVTRMSNRSFQLQVNGTWDIEWTNTYTTDAGGTGIYVLSCRLKANAAPLRGASATDSIDSSSPVGSQVSGRWTGFLPSGTNISSECIVGDPLILAVYSSVKDNSHIAIEFLRYGI